MYKMGMSNKTEDYAAKRSMVLHKTNIDYMPITMNIGAGQYSFYGTRPQTSFARTWFGDVLMCSTL